MRQANDDLTDIPRALSAIVPFVLTIIDPRPPGNRQISRRLVKQTHRLLDAHRKTFVVFGG
jgi:hypothetical protein